MSIEQGIAETVPIKAPLPVVEAELLEAREVKRVDLH